MVCYPETVYYEDSEEDWNSIDIQWEAVFESGWAECINPGLVEATIYYNYSHDGTPNDGTDSNTPPSENGDTYEDDSSDLITVPDVIGMEQIAAVRLLNDLGLQFQVWWDAEDEDGDVLYIAHQSIPAETEVEIGTLIRLQISKNAS